MRKIKNYILITITVMACFLVFASVGIADTPLWGKEYLPVQICMFTVGMAWLWLFGEANGWGNEDDEDVED